MMRTQRPHGLLVFALLVALLRAEVTPQTPDTGLAPIRALVLRRSDLDLFTTEDRLRIRSNQQRYLKAVVDKFYQSFDDVLTVSAHEFTELWDKYLETLKRNDLIDAPFKGTLGDAWIDMLTSHPRLAVETPLPVTFSKATLKRTVDRHLIDSERSDLTKDQLEVWRTIEPSSFEESLKPIDPELEALSKIQKARYLSARGDHIRHLLFSLDRFINDQKESNFVDNEALLAKRFFRALAFLKWTGKRESKLLRDLYQLRLKQLGDHKTATRSIEDLVAKMENTDHFRQLLDQLESEAGRGNTNSHLERLLELSDDPSHVDPQRLANLKTLFVHFRNKTPLDPKSVVRSLKQVYYPDFVKTERLLNACKQFSLSLGVRMTPNVKPLTRLYADELQHFKVIEPEDAGVLHDNVDKMLKLSPRRLGSVDSAAIQNIMKSFGMANPTVIPLTPYSPEFRRKFSGTPYKTSLGKVNNGIRFDISPIGNNVVTKFYVEPGTRPKDNIWTYVDTMTPLLMTYIDNTIDMSGVFSTSARKVPKTYFSKFLEIPSMVPPQPLTLHVDIMRNLIRPLRSITGLTRLKYVLGRYAEHFHFPPVTKKYWMKMFLKLASRTYRDRRRINICAVFHKLRDRPSTKSPKTTDVVQGTIVLPNKPQSTINMNNPILGRYEDFELLKRNFGVKMRQIVSLVELIKRKRTEQKTCVLLQKLVDRPIPNPTNIISVLQALNTAPNLPSEKRKAVSYILGRAADGPLPDTEKKLAVRTIVDTMKLLRTRSQKRVYLTLQRYQDRKVTPPQLVNTVHQAFGKDYNHDQFGSKKTIVVFGKSVDVPQAPNSNKVTLRSFLATKPKFLTRLDDEISFQLSRYRDRPPKLYTVYTEVLQNLRTIFSDQGGVQDKQFEMLFGRGQDVPMSQINLKTHIYNILQANKEERHRVKHYINLELSRYRDRPPQIEGMLVHVVQNLDKVVSNPSTVQEKQAILLTGKVKDFPQDINGLRNHIHSLFRPSAQERKRIDDYLNLQLARYQDRKPDLPQIYLTFVENLDKIVANPSTLEEKRAALLTGKFQEAPLDTNGLRLHILSMMRPSKLERQRIDDYLNLQLARYQDRKPDLAQIYLTFIENLDKIVANPSTLEEKRAALLTGKYEGVSLDINGFKAHIEDVLQPTDSEKRRIHDYLTLQLSRYRDRKPDLAQIYLTFTENLAKVLVDASAADIQQKRASLLLGKHTDVNVDMDGLRLRMYSLLRPTVHEKKRLDQLIDMQMSKYLDRKPILAQVYLNVLENLDKIVSNTSSLEDKRWQMVFGRGTEAPVSAEALRTKVFSILQPTRDEAKRIEHLLSLHMAKYEDRRPVLVRVYLTVMENLGSVFRSRGQHSQAQTMFIMGRGEDAKMYPANLKKKIISLLGPNLRHKLRTAKNFQLYLQRLKDKLIRPNTVMVRAQAGLFVNDHKTLAKVSGNRGFMERIQDHDLVNPRYALAIVGCFERFFSDIRFASWSDLHSAMRQYLEAVRDLDSRNTSFEFIRRALVYLQPFYKKGNLNYSKFFNNFRGDVKVELMQEYAGQKIMQILGKQVMDCATTLRVFAQLRKLVGCMYPTLVAADIDDLLKDIEEKAKTCGPQFSLAELIEHNLNQAAVAESDSKYRRFQNFLDVTLSDVIALKTLVNKGGKVFTVDYGSLASFFEQNQSLLRGVYGQALLDNVSYVLGLLRQVNFQSHLALHEIFALSDDDIDTRITATFGEFQDVLAKIRLGFQLMRVIFKCLGRHNLTLIPFSHYTFSGEVANKMGFCSRYSSKITTLSSKIKEKKFWKKTQLTALATALESVAKEGSLSTHRFNTVNVRMYSNALRPFVMKTLMAAYVKHFGDLRFRDYDHHFKGLFTRFMDTFRKENILRRAEAKALTSILGHRQFFSGHQYNFKDVLVKYCSADVQRLATSSVARGHAGTSHKVNAVNRSRKRSSGLFGRIRDHGLYKALEIAQLRKNLKDLFHGQGAIIKVADLVGRLQRLRLKYNDKSVAHFVNTKTALNLNLTYEGNKRAKAFYRTFNKLLELEEKAHMKFQNDLVKVVRSVLNHTSLKRAIRRVVYKGLTQQLDKALKYYNRQVAMFGTNVKSQSQTSFKRLYHKYLQDMVMNGLRFRTGVNAAGASKKVSRFQSFRRKSYRHHVSGQDIRQELQSLQKAGGRQSWRNRTKTIRRQRFKSAVGDVLKSLALQGRNRASRFENQLLARSTRKRRFKSLLNDIQNTLSMRTKSKKAASESKVVKALSFRRKQLKYVEASDDIKLSFLKKALAPHLADRLRSSTFTKRFFLKKLDASGSLGLRFMKYMKANYVKNSIFLRSAGLSKRYHLKMADLLANEQLYLKFLEHKFRAPFVSEVELVKHARSKRMRLKMFEDALGKFMAKKNKKAGGAFWATRQTLRDFGRQYLTSIKVGKRIGGGPKPTLEFIKIAQRLVKKAEKVTDLGRIAMPDINAAGKRIGTKTKIFCCGCACSTCVTDEACATGAGMEECLEHQKRINSDATFIKRAASMVNIDPVVNFFINVKSDNGGYVERKVLRFGGDPNAELFDQVAEAEQLINRKI
jgi:hypothetical protein